MSPFVGLAAPHTINMHTYLHIHTDIYLYVYKHINTYIQRYKHVLGTHAYTHTHIHTVQL